MYILHKTRQRSGGWARTFLRQLEDVLPACVERGITVVSNAGGLNPEGLADAVRELGRRQGVDVAVASVSGDDITPRLGEFRAVGERFVNLDTGEELPDGASVVTANAYLRARPIADALAAGAQVVVTGRVTDAALVVGPALHAFGWGDDDFDAVAGAVVAGHVIECGAQCCGGNYAFFEEIPGRARIGFPIAEVHADGSCGDHQASRDRRSGHGRNGDGAAALRDRWPALPQPGCGGALRHHRAGPGRAGPRADRARARRAAAVVAQGHRQPRRGLAQLHDAGPDGGPGGREGRASPPMPCGRASRAGAPPSPRVRSSCRGTWTEAAWRTCAWRCAATTSGRSAGPSPGPSSRPASRATRAPSSPPPLRAPRAWPVTGRRR